jgi:hypothetical protein
MKRAVAVLSLFAACSGKPVVTPPAGVTHTPGLANNHVPGCIAPSACGSGDEPPPGGPHCPSWLPCRVFTTAQNRCEWLHNLEHGHLVLAYNCPQGCDDVVQALTGFHASLPSPKRALVTPDPLLKTRVAAIVWGYTWAGDSVDVEKLDAIRSLQDTDAPEPGLGCNP